MIILVHGVCLSASGSFKWESYCKRSASRIVGDGATCWIKDINRSSALHPHEKRRRWTTERI